jgi:hypothetical protein
MVRVSTTVLMLTLVLSGCGGDADDSPNVSAEAHRAGWLFELSRTSGEDTYNVQQLLMGDKETLRNRQIVIPVLKKFLSKMLSGDTLSVGPQTTDGGAVITDRLLVVGANQRGYTIYWGKDVSMSAASVTPSAVEDQMSMLLDDGVSIMIEHESFGKWTAQPAERPAPIPTGSIGSDAYAGEHHSGWWFQLASPSGEEWQIVHHLLMADKEKLRDPQVVLPVFRRFVAKMTSNDVLRVDPHASGRTKILFEVHMNQGEYVLVRGSGITDATAKVSGLELERQLSALLEREVSWMVRTEASRNEFAERNKQEAQPEAPADGKDAAAEP